MIQYVGFSIPSILRNDGFHLIREDGPPVQSGDYFVYLDNTKDMDDAMLEIFRETTHPIVMFEYDEKTNTGKFYGTDKNNKTHDITKNIGQWCLIPN